MSSNNAAWQPRPGVPLEIKEAVYESPSDDYVLIRNHAIALNPIDFKLQDMALFPFLSYPTILGMDIAGEVAEVGKNVSSRFRVGDRVLATSGGVSANTPSKAGFQEYTLVVAKMVSHIPDNLSYAEAAVVPLGATTAAAGMFQQDHLAMQYPSASPNSTGQTLLVWSGASSVGINAIQLAIASGYKVIATASSKNFNLLRNLGVSEVFDYNADPATLLEQLTNAFKERTIAGVLHTAGPAADAIAICEQLFSNVSGNKFFTTTVQLPAEIPAGFKHNRIFASTIEHNGVGEAVFVDFLPQALAQRRYKALPEAEIVGNGLEYVQNGLDILRKGVSAKKLVVTLN